MAQGTADARHQERRGFTIIEMLVVLFIVAILTGIVITLAQRVTKGGRYSATRNVIEVAEGMLTEYVTKRESGPPMFVTTTRTQMNTAGTDDQLSPDTYMFPIIDGRYVNRTFPPNLGGQSAQFDRDLDSPQPSAALLLLAMTTESTVVERELKSLDSQFVQQRDVFAYGWQIDTVTGEPTGGLVQRRLRVPVLLDAFGNMIRYVQPAFQGGAGTFFNNNEPSTSTNRNHMKVAVTRQNGQQVVVNFTRSYRPFPSNAPAKNPVGDADEGLAVGGHGYFYSPGHDGDPGTRADNVYLKQPTFPAETMRLN